MSRAFVKEEEGVRWTPPGARRAFVLVWTGEAAGSSEVMRETDDLLDALRWLSERHRPGFELRDEAGVVLARNDDGPN